MPITDPAIDGPLLDKIEILRKKFEAAWDVGCKPRISDCLTQLGTNETNAQYWLLVELVKTDICHRWLTNTEPVKSNSTIRCADDDSQTQLVESAIPDCPLLENYVVAYPLLGDVDSLPPELVAEEYMARCRADKRPKKLEYRERFPRSYENLEPLLERVNRELKHGRPLTISREADELQRSKDGTLHPRSLNVRCPKCRTSIPISDMAPALDVVCTTCIGRVAICGIETRAEAGRYRWQTTFEHFELMEQLGYGAFGVVWKARDTQLDRIVAIKIPRKKTPTDEQPAKFVREARAAAQLNHPNIVNVYDVRVRDNSAFIVSEFVDGRSLSSKLAVGARLEYREAAKLCSKLAEALRYAHQQGVIHRDLKPANVIIDGSGEPHITDFGLARRLTGEATVTTEGQILGTPAYMSPEQACGDAHDADHRTDIYSLGVILYEMLTGTPPFRGSIPQLLHKVVHAQVQPPSSICDGIPTAVDRICLRCLEKDPVCRYDYAGDLAADLDAFLASKTVAAESRRKQAWRRLGSRRWAARIVAFGFGGALAILTSLIVDPISPQKTESSNSPTWSLEDSTNLESDYYCIKTAAEISIEEAQAEEKINSLTILVSKGWNNHFDVDGQISNALLCALEDCTQEVRYAAVQLIYCRMKDDVSQGLGEEIRKSLSELATGLNDAGELLEPSKKIRSVANDCLKLDTNLSRNDAPNAKT